jgi:hypothetical protein
VLFSTLFAVLGTAGIEAVVGPLYRPHSGHSAILKAWTLDVVVASLLGVIVQLSLKNTTMNWAWVLPAAAFSVRASSYAVSAGNLFGHFSGQACAVELQGTPCTDFFLFTVPLIRGLSYSVGGVIVAYLRHSGGEARVA